MSGIDNRTRPTVNGKFGEGAGDRFRWVVAPDSAVVEDSEVLVGVVPVAAWGALIEFTGWVCPLTPLENHFRRLAGGMGYRGGFIEHYVIPIMYPAELTTGMQLFLGFFVLLINGLAYAIYFKGGYHRRQPSTTNQEEPRV